MKQKKDAKGKRRSGFGKARSFLRRFSKRRRKSNRLEEKKRKLTGSEGKKRRYLRKLRDKFARKDYREEARKSISEIGEKVRGVFEGRGQIAIWK